MQLGIELVTSAGETAEQVAANLAALINADPTLAALGVGAEVSGASVATEGEVTFTEINDSGLAPGGVP